MNRFDIWIANLNPQKGTKIGKIRPVLIVQSDILNEHLSSVIVVPLSSSPWTSKFNHIKINSGDFGLEQNSTLLLDQICALDKQRFIHKVGQLPASFEKKVESGLKKMLNLT